MFKFHSFTINFFFRKCIRKSLLPYFSLLRFLYYVFNLKKLERKIRIKILKPLMNGIFYMSLMDVKINKQRNFLFEI